MHYNEYSHLHIHQQEHSVHALLTPTVLINSCMQQFLLFFNQQTDALRNVVTASGYRERIPFFHSAVRVATK